MHPMYYEFFLRIKARLTTVISIHIVYLFFKEGILGASGRNTCELLTTRKERNEYLFNFYLGRMNLNTFMEFLRSPDSNVDAPLLEHIEAEIAVLRERVKRRRKTTPKRLPSSVKEEVVVVESEVRTLLKKSKNSAPVAGTSFVPMTLPVSLPPTTDVCRAAPNILRKRRSAATSTTTSYKLPIASVTAAPPNRPPPPCGLPPGITAEGFAGATNARFSVEAPNAVVNRCKWVPASLHTSEASGATLRLDGGKTTLPIVGCHFIAESGVVAVYKLKDTDNNFVNLDAFRQLITHHRKELLGAFGGMFAPWSASKLIIPFERHLHNNFIIPSAVYDELKHPLSTPDMKAKRYLNYFMISNLHEIVGLLNVMQTFYQTTQALRLCLDTFRRVRITLD